jgi:hypothetical protein
MDFDSRLFADILQTCRCYNCSKTFSANLSSSQQISFGVFCPYCKAAMSSDEMLESILEERLESSFCESED